jgi:hypothetical protein
MKTQKLTPKLLAAAAAGSLFLAGCLRDENPTDDGSSEGTVLVEGRVQGDAALRKSAAGAGVEGAVITVARIESDGSLRTVSTAEAKTDAQGHFSIPAPGDGARELIVRAKKDGREWKAVVSAKAEKGKTVACRPLDLESSLEADVLAQARAGQAGAKASFVDIASAVDAEVAAQAEAKPEAKAGFEAYLSSQVRTEAQARVQALLTGSAQSSQARIDQAEEARLEAEAKLEADLDAAADLSAEARAKLAADFKQAEHQAWIDAGLGLATVTAASESCYQAMVKAGAQASVDAGEKSLWLRKIALEHASNIEIAVDADLKAKGADAAQVGGAAALGAALETSLQAAATEAALDSAFLRFRSGCANLRVEIPGLAAGSHEGGAGFTLSGKVEGGIAGADVQVAQVKADGSLQIVDGVKGTTDAQGGFTLNANAKLPDSMVVVVTHADQKLMVYVDSATPSPVQVGTETTVEARIVQQIAKDGSGLVTPEAVKAQVDSGVAAEVKGNDTAIARVLAGMEAAAKAQGSLLVTSGGEARDSAVLKARSLELYAQALARFTVGLSAEAEFRMAKAAHVAAGASLRVAAEGAAKAAGASGAALDALVQAGASLQASLEAAVNAEAIVSAYDNYHAAVTACLESALVLQASAYGKADAAIRAADGARATLMSKLAAAADADAAAKAQADFAAQVEAEAKADFGTGLGAPSDAQMKVIIAALVLANMGG